MSAIVDPNRAVANEDKTTAPLTYSQRLKATATGWTDEEKKQLDFLVTVNGYDAYNSEVAGLGTIPVAQYLQLPADLKITIFNSADVGKASNRAHLTTDELAKVYILNKAVCPVPADAIKYATARVAAVEMGWVTDQTEITRVDTTTLNLAAFKTDFAQFKEFYPIAQTYAFLQPIIAEFVFRTTGHHYLSGAGQGEGYRAKYHKLYTACLKPELSNFMETNIQLHNCLHWVGPARARSVLLRQMDGPTIPDAIKIRANAAPAGTALVTTTVAVLDLALPTKVEKAIEQHMGIDTKTLRGMAKELTFNPGKFHKTASAYGIAPLSDADKHLLEDALEMARKLAPVTLAIVEVFGRDTELAQAKALKKHSLSNPILTRRLRNYMRDQLTKASTNIHEVFNLAGSGPEE